MSNHYTKKFLGVLLFIAVFAAAVAIVMLLWNALIPQIIGWTAINYWQAGGLVILCRLLFGGFRNFGRRGHCFDRKHHKHHKHNLDKLKEEMKGMSRDERRNFFRERMRNRHPFGDIFDESDKSSDRDSRD